jgi:hypothetical protein
MQIGSSTSNRTGISLRVSFQLMLKLAACPVGFDYAL